MPTCRSSSSVRARAIWLLTGLWSCMISMICASIVCSGLSEVIGSWKMIEMSLPRMPRIWLSDSDSNSCPLKRMLPDGCEAAGYGSNLSTDSALTDLPEPDSPTRATHSPRLISNEMRSTATEILPCWRKATERSRMESSGWLMASIIPSRERLARIEGVTDGFADEDQERQHDGDGEEAG